MAKIREELFEQIKDVRTSALQITNALGELTLDEQQIKVQREVLLKNYNDLLASEKALLDAINKEYGEGNLDLASGEFTPNEQK